jgi:hypothetical protein
LARASSAAPHEKHRRDKAQPAVEVAIDATASFNTAAALAAKGTRVSSAGGFASTPSMPH